MTEPAPEQPPTDGPPPTEPSNPTPDEPPPTEEEPGEEQPPVPSQTPCTAVWPGDPAITCEIEFDNHFEFRLVHTRHTNDTVYEWE